MPTQCLKLLEVATSPLRVRTWLTGYKRKFLGSSAVYVVRMSALIQLAQMMIQLALVQKQLAFWTQLAYNFRHCAHLCMKQLRDFFIEMFSIYLQVRNYFFMTQ